MSRNTTLTYLTAILSFTSATLIVMAGVPLACAGQTASDMSPPPWCLPLPVSDDDQQVIDMQRSMYEQLFADAYDVCADMLLPLDADVTQEGQWITGMNAVGEAFGVDVIHIALRIDDWTQVDGLTPEEIAQMQAAQATFTRFIGEIHGPGSVVSCSAIVYSVVDNGGGRVTYLMPAYDYTAGVEVADVDPCPEGQGDPLYAVCTGNAAEDWDDCRNDAYNTYDSCLRHLFWETAFWGGADCVLGLASGGLSMIGCGGVYIKTAAKGMECDSTFANDMARCRSDHDDAMRDCCEAAAARREIEQKHAQPQHGQPHHGDNLP